MSITRRNFVSGLAASPLLAVSPIIARSAFADVVIPHVGRNYGRHNIGEQIYIPSSNFNIHHGSTELVTSTSICSEVDGYISNVENMLKEIENKGSVWPHNRLTDLCRTYGYSPTIGGYPVAERLEKFRNDTLSKHKDTQNSLKFAQENLTAQGIGLAMITVGALLTVYAPVSIPAVIFLAGAGPATLLIQQFFKKDGISGKDAAEFSVLRLGDHASLISNHSESMLLKRLSGAMTGLSLLYQASSVVNGLSEVNNLEEEIEKLRDNLIEIDREMTKILNGRRYEYEEDIYKHAQFAVNDLEKAYQGTLGTLKNVKGIGQSNQPANLNCSSPETKSPPLPPLLHILEAEISEP